MVLFPGVSQAGEYGIAVESIGEPINREIEFDPNHYFSSAFRLTLAHRARAAL